MNSAPWCAPFHKVRWCIWSAQACSALWLGAAPLRRARVGARNTRTPGKVRNTLASLSNQSSSDLTVWVWIWISKSPHRCRRRKSARACSARKNGSQKSHCSSESRWPSRNYGVKHQVLVGATPQARRMFERGPVNDAVVVAVRVFQLTANRVQYPAMAACRVRSAAVRA